MGKIELPPGEVPPEEVQEANVLVCAAFSEMFKPMLGPLGSKKLIMKGALEGEAPDLVANNAYAIIRELKYGHPTADLIIEAGISQGRDAGDGVATVLILIGELARRGYELKLNGIHQNVIVRGYEKALQETFRILDEMARAVDVNNDGVLENVALSALKKSDYWDERKLAEIVVRSVRRIEDERPIDVDDVTLVSQTGAAVYETKFFDGVVVDREVLGDLPKRIEDAKIALLDYPIEYREPKSKVRRAGRQQDVYVKITAPSQLSAFMRQRKALFEEIVERVVESGANVLCCQQGIDDEALDIFRDAGIMALKRVKNTDLKRLKRATGAEIVKNIEDLTPEKLGYARLVHEVEVGNEKYVFFEGCPYPKASAIILRGASHRVLEGVVSQVKSALHCVAATIEDGKVLPGGGAVEVEVAKRLRKFANSLPGKEQLAVNAFADALETIPLALAKNCGLDPIDTLVALRAEHADGNRNTGLSAKEKEIKDAFEAGILEPLRIKKKAIMCATSAAIQILKIEDLHIAKRKEEKKLDIEKEAPEFRFKGGRIKYY